MNTKERIEYIDESATRRDRPAIKELDKSHQDKHIIILNDSSFSVSDSDSSQACSTIIGVVKKLYAQNPNNQFSCLEFSTQCVAHVRVSSDLNYILEKLPKQRTPNLGGGTNLADALSEVMVIVKNEMTDSRKVFLLIFTDGHPEHIVESKNRANDLKLANVEIICVGIGSGIDKTIIESIASHKEKGYKISEWGKLNETLNEIMSKEFQDTVRVKCALQKCPYYIGESIKIRMTIFNDDEKEIPKGTIIKFYQNSYLENRTFKTMNEIEPESKSNLDIEVHTKDGVTVRDICKELEFSITTPSGSVLEKGRIQFWASDFGYQVINYRPPPVSKATKLYIAIFGSIGSGKSSFFNRIVTYVDGLTSNDNKQTSFVPTAPGGDHVTKCCEKIPFSKIAPKDQVVCDLPFVMCDSFGISEKTFTEPTLFPSWLRGMLGESFEMNESIMTMNVERSEANQVHCIMFFLAQGDRGDKELIEKIKKMYQDSLSYGYQPLVIVTKMDEVREQETKKQVIEQVSSLINANADSIFATENYHGGNMLNDEAERNFTIDKETLVILLKLFDKGDFFIKSKSVAKK